MLAPAEPTLDLAADPVVAVTGLTVTYGGRPAVADVTWSAVPGRLVAVVGPNGAGKSTLLKALLGLVPVSAGEVRLFGRPLAAVRQRIAYVPQRASVDWDFPASALDVVTMGLTRRIGWFRPVRRRHRVQAAEALAMVGLADLAARPIGALSGGQQQRVFLARALVQDADVLLLDEPLAGVDAATEQVVFDVFARLKRAGKLVVCVHHDLSTVVESFDDVVLMGAGRLVASGPTADVLTSANLAKAYGAPLLAAH